jgi:hypothetical protein
MNTTGEKIFCEVPIPIKVTEGRARDLLCSALEGGSNYWYVIADYEFADGVSYDDFQRGGKFGPDPADPYWHPSQLIPFHEGCALLIEDREGVEIGGKTQWRLDREAMKQGLVLMGEKYRDTHWSNFVCENDDADTADVWLQLALFNEVVFG